MKARRVILQCLVGLVICHLVLLYIMMFVDIYELGEAAAISLLATTGAIMLIYPASWVTHLKGGRHAAYAAVTWVVLINATISSMSFMAAVLAGMTLPLSSSGMYDIMPMVLTALAICAAVMILALYLKQFKVIRISAWIMAIAAGYCALLTYMGFVVLEISRSGDILLAYAWAGFALAVLAACICVGKWRWHQYVGLSLLVILACLLVLDQVWGSLSGIISIIGSLCVFIAIFHAHSNILWQLPLIEGRLAMVRLLVQAMIVTAFLLGFPQFTSEVLHIVPETEFNDLCLALGLTMEVIAVMVTVIMPFYVAMVHIRINRKPADNQINYAHLQVTCPHCQTPQLLTASGQCCSTCRLQFHYRLTEPRCPGCDYLLIGYNKSECPECGMALEVHG